MTRSERVGRSYASALRMHAGIGREWSTNRLSKATKIARRTLRSYLSGDTEPSPDKHELLCAALGDGFRNLTARENGYALVPLDAKPIDPLHLHAQLSEVDAEMNRRRADGVFCHRDRAEMTPKWAALGLAMLSMARSA